MSKTTCKRREKLGTPTHIKFGALLTKISINNRNNEWQKQKQLCSRQPSKSFKKFLIVFVWLAEQRNIKISQQNVTFKQQHKKYNEINICIQKKYYKQKY